MGIIAYGAAAIGSVVADAASAIAPAVAIGATAFSVENQIQQQGDAKSAKNEAAGKEAAAQAQAEQEKKNQQEIAAATQMRDRQRAGALAGSAQSQGFAGTVLTSPLGVAPGGASAGKTILGA